MLWPFRACKLVAVCMAAFVALCSAKPTFARAVIGAALAHGAAIVIVPALGIAYGRLSLSAALQPRIAFQLVVPLLWFLWLQGGIGAAIASVFTRMLARVRT